ncbi:hypothetical protein [Nocardia carnea]|uniref:hypothetical protein n=1 Tax=Nocardia carnea TaxID=37328 RepID=UPI0024544EB6|nr:hypothetical protein [Nocardia carnea]
MINTRARVVARAVFEHLGWSPGQSLRYELRGGLITLTTAPAGHNRHTIATPGHIRLPAELRHATGITPGDALLLAAVPEHQLALIYPPWAQHTLLQSTLPPHRGHDMNAAAGAERRRTVGRRG